MENKKQTKSSEIREVSQSVINSVVNTSSFISYYLGDMKGVETDEFYYELTLTSIQRTTHLLAVLEDTLRSREEERLEHESNKPTIYQENLFIGESHE
jgi:hypothetical protein